SARPVPSSGARGTSETRPRTRPCGRGETRQRQARQRRDAGAGPRGLLVRGRRAGPVLVAAPLGGYPAAAVGPAGRGHLLRRAVSGAQRRGAARRDQQQSVSGQAGQHRRAPQGHHDPAARNRVYGAGVRLRAAGEPAARQAGGNAMKRIAALVPFLLVLAPGASPGMRGATPRDGEVKAVSVLPAAGSVEVVIDLRGAVDIQDFTLASPARLVVDLQGARLVAPAVLYDGANRGGIKNIRYAQFRPGVVRVVIDLDALKDYQIERRDGQVRVKIGSERTAFEAWSSRDVAALAPNPGPASGVSTDPGRRPGAAAHGGQAARVATPAQSGDEPSIDAYLAAHAKESAQSQAARITVTWDNADLREVVAGFAAFSGRTIILSKDVKGQVSAEIKNQPWDLAFNAVLESQGLAANVLDGGIIQVIDKRDLARADSTVPVETRLVRVNYAKAGALVPSVASILTKRGAVVADSTSNALVITEISSRINRVEEFVKGLDIRTPQVSIQ